MSGPLETKKRRTQVIDKQFHCQDNARTLLHSAESVTAAKKEPANCAPCFCNAGKLCGPPILCPSTTAPLHQKSQPGQPPADHNVWPDIIQRTHWQMRSASLRSLVKQARKHNEDINRQTITSQSTTAPLPTARKPPTTKHYSPHSEVSSLSGKTISRGKALQSTTPNGI